MGRGRPKKIRPYTPPNPNKGISVYKRGEKYYVQYKSDGFKTLSDAQKAADMLQTDKNISQ